MILGFVGLPGQGKTLGMVLKACQALKEGRRVVTNVPITDVIYKTNKTAEYEEDMLSVLKNAQNTLVCLDEASIVLPSYFWSRLDSSILMRFAQVRKYGLDIIYTSQGWNHTVKRLRDLTNFVVKAENHRYWYTYKYLDPEYYLQRAMKKFEHDYVYKTETLWPWDIQKAYRSYNTLHRVTYVYGEKINSNDRYNTFKSTN